MKSEWTKQTLSLVVCSTLLLAGSPAQLLQAQDASSTPPAVAPLSSQQLDSLVAPIALYPDALVAQVLGAATNPEQIAFADDWMLQNSTLQGSALTQAVDQQPWDEAVKALTQFPAVLHQLAKNLSWTSSLGQAFNNQQSDVMEAVQYMRAQAQAAGTLQSNSQIKVVKQSAQTIVIQPASSSVVYVPQYNPAVVFGSPVVVPAYAPPPVPVAAGISFGAGVAVGAAIGGAGFVAGGGGGWGFGAWGMNWGGGGGGGGPVVNNNTYINKTNINRNSNNNINSNNNDGHNTNFSNNGNHNGLPNGGPNGNHGLIGGPGGVQHPVTGPQQNQFANRGDQPGNRGDQFGNEQPRSAMSGNGNLARNAANRGRTSMNPAAFHPQRPGQQRPAQHPMQQRQAQHPQPQRGGGRR
jgi:hypothetical protein